MNTRKAILPRLAMALAVVLSFGYAEGIFAQTTPNFTGISVTDEGAIQLTWASVTNETYEIDEADALGTNADGSTAWNQLYTEFASQGTNTFWLDTGNYFNVPPIVHPKYSPVRFYRITDLGPDTTSDEPSIVITSPINGSLVSGSLTVTVLASTDQAGPLSTLLYVDGQEMQVADSTTSTNDGGTNYVTANYTINTCEWFNGEHILFATARCMSAPEGGEPNTPTPTIGHAVSTFVPVTFNNLVTEIAFSQTFFDPALGQTQQVTAIFAADSDWTLTITDANSNTVRTATGSGTTMSFNWDGTGTGGTNLPAGVYWYYVSAATNGQTLALSGGGSSSGGAGPPAPEAASSESRSETELTHLWAQPADGSGIAVPLIIYPPGFDTNDLSIFEEPVSWNPMVTEASATESSVLVEGGRTAASPAGVSGYSGGSSQSAPAAPVRPSTAPIRGTVGTFGVAYQTYIENGTNGYTLAPPKNCIITGPIKIQTFPTTFNINSDRLPQHGPQAKNFAAAMKKGGWNASFVTADNQVTTATVTGAGSPFNQVNLGLLLLHGCWGGSADDCYNGCKQMYFPIGNFNGGASWVSLGQMNFGGTATNGLEWMALDACFSLYHPNWTSMQSANVKPYNNNFHLLLGIGTFSYTDPNLEAFWAKYMLFGKTPGSPMTIQAAWYQGARDAYQAGGLDTSDTLTFAVAGDANCSGDYLQTNSPPTGTQFYNSTQVYP